MTDYTRPIVKYEDILNTAKEWDLVDARVAVKEAKANLLEAEIKLAELQGEDREKDKEVLRKEKKEISSVREVLAQKSIMLGCAAEII